MNNQVFFFFYNLAHQSVFLDNVIVFLAVYFVYIVIILAILFLFFRYKTLFSRNLIKEFILLCLSGGIAWFLSKILKILIHAPRPFDLFSQVRPLFFESGYAFPSGHTTTAFAIAFVLYFINKKAGYVFMLFALLIGLARVTAGVHFPIDILGGFILGFIVSYIFNYFFSARGGSASGGKNDELLLK